MVPAWPQVLSQVLSQSCPNGLARIPYVRSKLAQVDKTVWSMSQLGICISPDSSSLEGPGRKKWHNTLIFGP